REPLAIDGKRIARRNAGFFAASNHERAEELHFALEETDSVRDRRRSKRIRADQLREIRRLMRRSHLPRPHLEKVDAVAALRELESALGTGEASADDFDFHRSPRPDAGRLVRGLVDLELLRVFDADLAELLFVEIDVVAQRFEKLLGVERRHDRAAVDL